MLGLFLAQVPPHCQTIPGSGSAKAFACTIDVPARTTGTHVPWVVPVLYIALWATLAVLASRDMERRGQSGVVWFVLVFFTQIIGLVLWLVMRTNYEVQPVRADPPRSTHGGTTALRDSPWTGSGGTTDQW